MTVGFSEQQQISKEEKKFRPGHDALSLRDLMYHFAVSYGGVGLGLASVYGSVPMPPELTLGLFVGSAASTISEAVSFSIKRLDIILRASYLEKNDKKLGFGAAIVKYEGDTDQETGLKTGDHFLYVRPPRFPTGEAGKDPLLVNDLWSYAFRTVTEQFSKHEFSHVAISLPNEDVPFCVPTNKGTEIRQKDIFAHRPYRPHEKTVLLLTREEFEHLNQGVNGLFDQLVRGLGDDKVSELASILHTAKTSTERERALLLLKSAVTRTLEDQLAMRFNGPVSERNRQQHEGGPTHAKYTPYSLLRSLSDGELYWTEIHTPTGAVDIVHLDRLLRMNDPVAVEEVVASVDLYRTPRIAYMLHKLLRENTLDMLIGETPLPTSDELIERLHSSPLPKPIRQESSSIGPKGTRKMLKPFLPILLYGLATTAAVQMQNEGAYTHPATEISQRSSVLPSLTRDVPSQTPQWKVEQVGTFWDKVQYWTESTSHTYSPSTGWEMETDRKEKLTIPETVPLDNQPYIRIQRPIHIPPGPAKPIKLPIPEGGNLSALRVSTYGQRGKEDTSMPVETHRLTDGTLEVSLPGGFGSTVWIEAIFLPVDKPTITPQTETTPHVDLQSVWYEQAEPKKIAETIVATHDYSLGAPDAPPTLPSDPQAMVITILQTSGFFCEPANTALALLTGANYSEGYRSSPDGYLTESEAHAYTTGSDGTIYDATPRSYAGDGPTQAYLRSQVMGPIEGPSLDDQWNRIETTLPEQAAQHQKTALYLQLLTTTLAGTASSYLLMRSAPLLKRLKGKINPTAWADRTVSHLYSKDDLSHAAGLFSWISYGKADTPPQIQSSQTHSLAWMRDNMRVEKIDVYLKNPERYETALNIPEKTRGRVRALAHYLIATG